jgi:hypothetical protein
MHAVVERGHLSKEPNLEIDYAEHSSACSRIIAPTASHEGKGFMRTVTVLASATLIAVALAHSQGGNARCEAVQRNAAADRAEKLYVGTDAADDGGYRAAQKAEEQLRLDFLNSFLNPQKNAANQTAWDEEEAQIIGDSMKYGGDRTLDAAVMYWGETHLYLPVSSPQELLAQAKRMEASNQPGERERAHGNRPALSAIAFQRADLDT